MAWYSIVYFPIKGIGRNNVALISWHFPIEESHAWVSTSLQPFKISDIQDQLAMKPYMICLQLAIIWNKTVSYYENFYLNTIDM